MKLAVIGTGKMGQALVSRFIEKNAYNAENVRAFDVQKDLLHAFCRETKTKACESPQEAIQGADDILLAVKPQVLPDVLQSLAPRLEAGQLLISIAAGISLETLQACSRHSPLVRVMPNLPAVVGEGVSALCFAGTDGAQEQRAIDLFSTCGLALPLPQPSFDAVTALSGSGPAYAFLAIEAMADAGVMQGLARADAQKMAAQTLLGAAKLLLEQGEHPARLKDQVTSPGGTTAAALGSLEKNGFRSALIEAVAAAAQRSRELGGLS